MVRFNLMVELGDGSNEENFNTFISDNGCVAYAATLDGNTEYSLTVECADMADFEKFVDELTGRFSLARFQSKFISRELKKSA